MVTLYVLDIPENVTVPEVAAHEIGVTIRRVGHYFEISAPEAITIDRRATGCRHAVWYSLVGALAGAHILQHDKDALKIVPLTRSGS